MYFQVLGEHGFFGLAFYLACLVGAFRKAGRIAKTVQQRGGPAWLRSMSSMLQLSIFAFALGGAALSFAYFDLIFTLFGLMIVIEARILPAALAGTRLAGDQAGTGADHPARVLPAYALTASHSSKRHDKTA